jgi:hypothetical protein
MIKSVEEAGWGATNPCLLITKMEFGKLGF